MIYVAVSKQMPLSGKVMCSFSFPGNSTRKKKENQTIFFSWFFFAFVLFSSLLEVEMLKKIVNASKIVIVVYRDNLSVNQW